MFRASVKQRPRKPSFFRRISVTIVGESEAARPCSPPSRDGTLRWPVMMPEKPAAIKSTEGKQVDAVHLPLGTIDEGERVVRVAGGIAVAGIVLGDGHDATTFESAGISDARFATASGSSPKERVPIIGLLAFVFTSTDGAKLMCMPISRH